MKTWFITGVSSGFGKAIAEAAWATGDRVVGTLRNEEQRKAFAALTPDRSFGVILGVTDDAKIEDYDALMNPSRERRLAMSGKQLGNPAKLGEAVVKLVTSDNPPAHLLLGSDAAKLVDQKLTDLRAEYDAWKDVTSSTDFAEDSAVRNSLA